MKLQAAQRLAALPNFVYDDLENEVRQHKKYDKLLRLCERLVDIQNKVKLGMIAFDRVQRPVAKELLFEETGADFSFVKAQLTAGINFKKLDFKKAPPEDFVDRFREKFKGPEARDKLWVYRRAVKSVIGTERYDQWMEAFNKADDK